MNISRTSQEIKSLAGIRHSHEGTTQTDPAERWSHDSSAARTDPKSKARAGLHAKSAALLTNRAAGWKTETPSGGLRGPFAGLTTHPIFLDDMALQKLTGFPVGARGNQEAPLLRKASDSGIGLAQSSKMKVHVLVRSILLPTEATMNAKKRRKIYGVRRETRRPRGWTRWFLEGLFGAEIPGSIRLRTILWGQKS